jgi:uncharacterized membrane protein
MSELPFVITGAGLLMTGLSIPLILGKVKPNRFYGIRTRAAFASEENWYRINRFGGKLMLGSAVPIVLVGAAGFLVPEPYVAVYGLLAAVVMLASALASTVIVLMKP